ncbi:MAG TPA: NAD(P)-binding domain-containing protein [Friedmanniella sp.]
MTSTTIFGTGNMGSAIGDLLTSGGAEVQHLGSNDDVATITGDVVVLAVPYGALADVVARYGDQLSGKTVVDITNPLDFATFDGLTVPAGSSAAAELAQALPGSAVLKAFNTTFAASLASRSVGPTTTTVLIAGDDADAKAALAEMITAGGADAVDAGSLKRAHELEALGFLQLTLAAGEKISWTGGFALQH